MTTLLGKSYRIKPVRHLVLMLASLVGSLAMVQPAQGQGAVGYFCTRSVQLYTVPAGLTSLLIIMNGAHGSYPSNGRGGGHGGFVQARVPVTPGQTLYVWVGCIEKDKLAWGYGNGGYKGTSPGTFGDGGFGGGGTAVALDAQGSQPLLVAGGGGGGGGNGPEVTGGAGGNGGSPAGHGHSGDINNNSGGVGGVITAQGNGGANGGDGVNGKAGSGGGGGGLAGGEAGKPADGGGGGGGGGGLSFADGSATDVIFDTSTLSKDGAVFIDTSASPVAEADADRVPDALDTCAASDLRPTVVIDGRETGAPNHQDVDGCTLADRIAQIAAGATRHSQFVRDVAELTRDYRRDNLLTRDERKAIIRAARQSNIPPRPHGRGQTSPDDHATEVDPDE